MTGRRRRIIIMANRDSGIEGRFCELCLLVLQCDIWIGICWTAEWIMIYFIQLREVDPADESPR